jgi:hypothetical protein
MDIDEVLTKRRRLREELDVVDGYLKKREAAITAIRIYDVLYLFKRIFSKTFDSFEYTDNTWEIVSDDLVVTGDQEHIWIVLYGDSKVVLTTANDELDVDFGRFQVSIECGHGELPCLMFLFNAISRLSDECRMISKIDRIVKTILETDRPIIRKCVLQILGGWEESDLSVLNYDVILIICKMCLN